MITFIFLLSIVLMLGGAVWYATHALVATVDAHRAAARFAPTAHRRAPIGRLSHLMLSIAQPLALLVRRIMPDPLQAAIQRALVQADLAALTPAIVGAHVMISGIFWGAIVGMCSPLDGLALGSIGAFIGGCWPVFQIVQTRRRRREAITRALPSTIELLALAVEAGSEFLMALTRVMERMPPGALRVEWERVLQAIRLGQSRSAALRDMADRVQLPAVTSVTTAIIQSDRLGAPLAEALRAQAEHLRFERFQRAERAGALASQKILLPIVCCILPAFILLLLGGVLIGLATEGVAAWTVFP